MVVDRGLMRFMFPAVFALSLILFLLCRTGFVLNRLAGLFFVQDYFGFVGISGRVGSW
jgi:hypothetical protein